MEIHIIQNGLNDLHSHYFNETLAWRDAISELGQNWNCYAHQTLSPDHCRQTGAIPAFQCMPDVIMERDPQFAPLSDFIDLAEIFAADCQRVLGPAVRGGDLVLVPYATEREMFGAALWLRGLTPAMRPRMAFIVHRPDWNWSVSRDRQTVTGNTNFWRYAGKRLALVTKDMAPFIGARDERLRLSLRQILGMDVRRVPMSTFMRRLPDGVGDVAKEFDLGMIGQYRPERGSGWIAGMLAEVAKTQPHSRFLLQVETAEERDRISRLFADAGSAGRAEIVVGNQTFDRFYWNAARCRMLILPYVPDRYRMRSSGVLSVAVGLGIPVIVPADTWLSDRIQDGSASGFVYDGLNASFLTSILARPPHEWDAMARIAAGLAVPWRQRHSTLAVLNQILEFCNEQPARSPS